MTSTTPVSRCIGLARSRLTIWIALFATWLTVHWRIVAETFRSAWLLNAQSLGVPLRSLNSTRKPLWQQGTPTVQYTTTEPARDAEGRLSCTASYYSIERDLFRGGDEAYEALLYTAIDRKLDDHGGIGPYTHTKRLHDGAVEPHVLISKEA